ncbi:MAG: hypothetical protein QOF18_658 [Frankiaceae bacterium]|nr:hypothetical protein [Frankiaceae bacterium]
MNNKMLIPALLAAGVAGGVIGAGMLGSAQAATNPSPSSTSSPGTKWHSNTDPAHEAGESAARAAAEKKADATGVPPAGFGGPRGHSNTDPAHEAGESASRAAEEKARDASPGPSPGN